jgi:hypothetical protein
LWPCKPRLWGFARTAEYPVEPSEVVNAREQGINRTNAVDHFKSEVKDHVHQPFVQSMMESETSQKYKPSCWTKSYCKSMPKTSQKQHELLHKLFLKKIRDEIGSLLAPSAGKEFLLSGDAAIAVRFGSQRGSDVEHCKLFILARVSLKPLSATLVSMTVKEHTVTDSPDVSNDSLTACLDLNSDGYFSFQSSWELVADLLLNQKAATSVIYVNVLHHRPVFPGLFLDLNFKLKL